MKIVFTTTVYLPHIGGIEICIHELAQYMLKKGFEVSIIVADKNVKRCTREIIDGEKIIRIPAYEIFNFFVLRNSKYKSEIIDEIKDADVVHVNVCKFLFSFFANLKRKYGYRLVATSHGWLYHTNRHKFVKDLYFKQIIAKYAPYYDGIINVSPQDQDIAESFGVKDTCVILNGVDLKKFSGIEKKEKFDNKFVYFGRISENKGIYQCLEKLSEYKSNYRFYIIGKCEDAEYLNKLKTFIADNKMKDKVFFCGQLSNEEVRDKIIESDIILMPSLHEGFGMTLVECLVSNRPIIANDIESYRYILKSVNAEEYLFDYSSSDLISEKITFLCSKNINIENIDQFSNEEMARKTLEIYGL